MQASFTPSAQHTHNYSRGRSTLPRLPRHRCLPRLRRMPLKKMLSGACAGPAVPGGGSRNRNTNATPGGAVSAHPPAKAPPGAVTHPLNLLIDPIAMPCTIAGRRLCVIKGCVRPPVGACFLAVERFPNQVNNPHRQANVSRPVGHPCPVFRRPPCRRKRILLYALRHPGGQSGHPWQFSPAIPGGSLRHRAAIRARYASRYGGLPAAGRSASPRVAAGKMPAAITQRY